MGVGVLGFSWVGAPGFRASAACGVKVELFFYFIFFVGGLRVLGSSCFKGLGFGIRVAVQCGA